jgi:DNA polymerase-3 subunit gamma/tau
MRGVGKTTVARILAKALNCVHGPTPTPCNECEFCQAIANDQAIDVLEIDGAASRKVDEAREIREGLKYRPLHSRYKVVIIDEVHMLTPEAFATLLKILEEPPAKTVFIFATTEAHKVPKTIISRCQHFEFKRISHKDIVKHLEYIAREEGLSISREGLYLIAEAAEGSLRDAESILDKAAAFSGEKISDDDLKVLLGTVSQSLLFEVSRVIFAGQAGEVFSLVDKLVESGYELVTFYHQLIHHFRKILLAKTMPNFRDIIPVNEEEYQQYLQEAQKVSEEELLRYLNALLKEEVSLKHSFQPRIYLETILIKLCHFGRLVTLDKLLETIPGVKEMEEVASVEKPKIEIGGESKKQPSGNMPGHFRQLAENSKGQLEARFTSKEKPSSLPAGLASGRKVNEESSSSGKMTHSFSSGERVTSSRHQSSPSPVSRAASASPERKSSSGSSAPPRLKDKLLTEALKEPQVKEFLEIFKAQVLAIQPLSGRNQENPGIKNK